MKSNPKSEFIKFQESFLSKFYLLRHERNPFLGERSSSWKIETIREAPAKDLHHKFSSLPNAPKSLRKMYIDKNNDYFCISNDQWLIRFLTFWVLLFSAHQKIVTRHQRIVVGKNRRWWLLNFQRSLLRSLAREYLSYSEILNACHSNVLTAYFQKLSGINSLIDEPDRERSLPQKNALKCEAQS